jgi:hypothetical protein
MRGDELHLGLSDRYTDELLKPLEAKKMVSCKARSDKQRGARGKRDDPLQLPHLVFPQRYIGLPGGCQTRSWDPNSVDELSNHNVFPFHPFFILICQTRRNKVSLASWKGTSTLLVFKANISSISAGLFPCRMAS